MLGKHWKYGNPQVYTFVILIDAQTFQALQSNQISLRIGNSKTQWKVEYFRCQIWGKVRPNQLSFQGHSQGIMQRQLIPSEKKKYSFEQSLQWKVSCNHLLKIYLNESLNKLRESKSQFTNNSRNYGYVFSFVKLG